MAFENTILTAGNYGTVGVKTDGLSYGMHILGSTDEGRINRTAYFNGATADDFGIQVIFKEWEDMDAFALWMINYIYRVQDPDGGVGPMVVMCAQRNFFKVGIPSSGIARGRRIDSINHRLLLTFTGTSGNINDPNLFTGEPVAPKNQGQGQDPNAGQFFYPRPPDQFVGAGKDQDLYDAVQTVLPALQSIIQAVQAIAQ